MKYYLIAGENSGDLHTAKLMQALKKRDSKSKFRYIGGKKMQEVDKNGLFMDLKKLNMMGFWEVFKSFMTLRKYIKTTKIDILNYHPNKLILVDFAGFNLYIAKFAKKQGIKVIYYISPKIWAWHEKRVHRIKRLVDEMYVILPFEKQFYERYDYKVRYFGNPLIDYIRTFKEKHKPKPLSNKKIIALLPGSRKQEVSRMLPIMLSIAKYFRDDYEFIVSGITNIPNICYESAEKKGFKIMWDISYELLNQSFMALVTSGTATLETAIFKVPQVVCYKTSQLSYFIAKQLVTVDYISLVNLIAGKEVVKELIQQNCNTLTLKKSILEMIDNREHILKEYENVNHHLGQGNVAEKITLDLLENN